MTRSIVVAGLLITAALTLGCGSQVPLFGDYDTAVRWRDRGDYPRAEANFTRGIYHDPNDFHCWTGRGEVRAAMSNFNGAMDDFNKALEINPKYSVAYVARGKVRARDVTMATPRAAANGPEIDAAIADFSTAIELDPQDQQALVYRAMMYAVRRDFPRAMVDINRGVAVNPLQTNALGVRWGINILRGDDVAAAADEQAVLRPHPVSKESLQRDAAEVRAARGH